MPPKRVTHTTGRFSQYLHSFGTLTPPLLPQLVSRFTLDSSAGITVIAVPQLIAFPSQPGQAMGY